MTTFCLSLTVGSHLQGGLAAAMHSVPSAVWHGIPAPRSEHSDDGTSRSGSVWAGNAYLDSSVHGTTAGPRRSDSWRARVAAGGGDGVDIEAIAGIAAVDIALARGEVARIVARQPARRVGRSNTNTTATADHDEDDRGGFGQDERAASVTAKNPYRDAIVNALGHLAKDAGGIAWIEVWARDDEDSDELHLQTSWLNRGGRMVAPPALARALKTPAQPCAPGVRLPGTLFALGTGSPATLGSPVHWRPLAELAANPDVQHDDFVRRLEEALPGASACGVVTRDASVMLLMVTMPPERWDVRAPPPPCEGTATAAPMLRAGAEAVAGMLWMGRARLAHVAGRRARAARAWSALRALARTRALRNMVVTAQYTFAAGLLEPERAESSKATDDSRGRGGDFGAQKKSPNSPNSPAATSAMRSYVLKVWNKCKGAGGVPMPRDNWEKTAYTFVYVFVTLVAFSAMDEYAVRRGTDGAHTILLGSMGALCTLMYSAPASPLTQPRNVLFGHVTAAVVGAAVNAITADDGDGGLGSATRGMPRWVAKAVAPAVAIAALGRMGITHPPAGAVSIIAVSDRTMIELGFRAVYLPVFAMAALSIAFAAVLNNSNSKRQYPMVW